MLEKEILTAFCDELGWKLKRSGRGRFCVKLFPDRSLKITPQLSKLDGEQVLETFPTISTDEFSSMCAKIYDCKDPYESLFALSDYTAKIFYSSKFSLTDIREIDERLSSWAISQDLEKLFSNFENWPLGAFGGVPERHLVALALAGDVAKLKSYQASFAAGDLLGFMGCIPKDYIDRALALAEQKVSNS